MPSKSGGTHARRAAGAANSTAGMARQGSNNGAATAAAGLAGLGAASSGAVAGGGGGAINSNGTHAHEGIEGVSFPSQLIYPHTSTTPPARASSCFGHYTNPARADGLGHRPHPRPPPLPTCIPSPRPLRLRVVEHPCAWQWNWEAHT